MRKRIVPVGAGVTETFNEIPAALDKLLAEAMSIYKVKGEFAKVAIIRSPQQTIENVRVGDPEVLDGGVHPLSLPATPTRIFGTRHVHNRFDKDWFDKDKEEYHPLKMGFFVGNPKAEKKFAPIEIRGGVRRLDTRVLPDRELLEYLFLCPYVEGNIISDREPLGGWQASIDKPEKSAREKTEDGRVITLAKSAVYSFSSTTPEKNHIPAYKELLYKIGYPSIVKQNSAMATEDEAAIYMQNILEMCDDAKLAARIKSVIEGTDQRAEKRIAIFQAMDDNRIYWDANECAVKLDRNSEAYKRFYHPIEESIDLFVDWVETDPVGEQFFRDHIKPKKAAATK